jgi:hypothetical protein
MITQQLFRDESPLSGVREFLTPRGRMRVMHEGTHYGIYLYHDGSFVRQMALPKAKGVFLSPRQIYTRFVEEEN